MRVPNDNVAFIDLDQLQSTGQPFPAPMNGIVEGGVSALERACDSLELVSRTDGSEVSGSAQKEVSAERFLAALKIDFETELERADSFGPAHAVRFIYARRDDERTRRLALITECSNGLLSAASFLDARGSETVLAGDEAVRAGATRASDHFEVGCARTRHALAQDLLARGLSAEDADWFLAQVLDWSIGSSC